MIRAYIYDLDTALSFPCTAQEYAIKAFKPELQLKEEYQRYIYDGCHIYKILI